MVEFYACSGTHAAGPMPTSYNACTIVSSNDLENSNSNRFVSVKHFIIMSLCFLYNKFEFMLLKDDHHMNGHCFLFHMGMNTNL